MPPPVWPFRRRDSNGSGTPRTRPAYPSPSRPSELPPTPPPPPPLPPLDPLLRWKLGRWFDCLRDDPPDAGRAEGPAQLTLRDYELAASRVARAFRHRPGSHEHRRLLACLRRLWRRHDRERTGALDREAFLEAVGRAAGRERRALVAAVNSLCCALVDTADADGDSLLSEREYRVLLSSGFRLTSEHDLLTAYRTLDRDNSGTLEHNEVHEAFVEFFTSTDPEAPGNWLLGAPRQRPGGAVDRRPFGA